SFVSSYADGVDDKRGRRVRRLLRVLLPLSLAPSAAAHVDVAAHLGGVAVGSCIGFLLQIFLREDKGRPDHAMIGGAVSAMGAVAVAISFAMVAFNFAHYAAHAQQTLTADAMIPDEQLRGRARDLIERSDEFVTHYPRDPRSHLYHALRFRIE